MKLIVCLDDRDGMLFNGRRQSRDRRVCEQILKLTAGSALWMNSYSAKLFADADIRIEEDFLNLAGDDTYCFAENVDVTPFLPKAEEIFVFRWNRTYPSEQIFPMDLVACRYKKATVAEFAGTSHERITLEVYTL